MENKTIKFLEEYNKLVNNLRKEMSYEPSSSPTVSNLVKAMSNHEEYKDWAIKLDKCRHIRNVLVNESTSIDLDLQMHLEVLEEFNKLDLSSIILYLKDKGIR